MPRRAVCALILVGCTEGGDDAAHFVVPFDGQTAVGRDEPLVVRAAELHLPPDYPVGDLVTVVDLADGGFVTGHAAHDGVDLTFHPHDRWRADTRYAWTLRVPAAVPHGPEFGAPRTLIGSAVFDTSARIDALAAGLDDNGAACLVLSAPLAEPPEDLRVTVDDAELEDAALEPLPFEDWDPADEVPDLTTAADVACLVTDTKIEVGGRLRVWLGDDGPTLAVVEDRHPREIVLDLHRATP